MLTDAFNIPPQLIQLPSMPLPQKTLRQDNVRSSADTSSRISVSSSGLDNVSSSQMSTTGSWDDSEQEYQSKATKQVSEMLEKIESVLFSETVDTTLNQASREECIEWSRQFPHIRVKGIQLLESKDISYHNISEEEARSLSPYFFLSSSDGAELSSHGVPPQLISKSYPLVPSEVELEPGLRPGITQACISDEGLSRLRTVTRKECPLEDQWIIFKKEIVKTESDDRKRIENDDDRTTPTPRDFGVDEEKISLEIYKEGSGNIKTLREALEKIHNLSRVDMVAFLRCRLGATHDPCGLFLSWEKEFTFDIDKVFSGSAERWTPIDEPFAFEGLDIQSQIRLYHTTLPAKRAIGDERDIFESSELIYEPTSKTNMEEIFALEGETDEYFAFDNSGDPAAFVTEDTPQESDPNNLKMEIINFVFEDLWPEIASALSPLLHLLGSNPVIQEPIRDSSTPTPKAAEPVEVEPDEQFDGLLSAMTIKPLSLQKRDASAKSKQDHHAQPPLVVQETFSRPTSAKPAQRPISAKSTPGFLRPTSARLHEAHLASMHRYQQQISQKPASAWKTRNGPGFRLIPLQNSQSAQSQQPVPMSDMVLGMGLMNNQFHRTLHGGGTGHQEYSRPGTSMNVNKRLPPLRTLGVSEYLPEPASQSHRIGKHVAFDMQELSEKRSASPKPRRQVSSALKGRLSRPQTALALEEMRATPIPSVYGIKSARGSRLEADRSFTPLPGMRIGSSYAGKGPRRIK